MPHSDIGASLALIIGLGGGLGTFFGGYLADRFAKRDMRWNLWVPALAIILAFPFTFGVYLSYTATESLLYFIIPAVVGTVYLGPSLAMVQALVPLRMRTVASAILLFIINIIGMGLGPQVVGILSDLLTDRFAQESMRYALFIAGFVNLWSAFHLFMGARTLRADLANAHAATV